MSARVRVESPGKTFGEIVALRDVALSIRDGEVLGLIGPNGAGKTTLLECLAGLRPADRGTVLANEVPLPAEARGRILFYLPDGITPWPDETVGWAIDFTVGYFGGRVAHRAEVIERLRLPSLLGRRMGALSKGQRKRALLGIALLTPQPVLLIDEPFDGLDLRQTREVGAALRDHARDGRAVCLSVHQIADAAHVGDRFVLLTGGRVVGAGSLAELADLARARSGAPASDLEEVVLALT